ncbi:MAG: hypothetical protein ACE5GD_05270 [Candidatus Geothermarchaeales archaeon]
MDITDLSIELYDAYQDMINSGVEDYEEEVVRFEKLLGRVSEIFGIEQFNLARFRYHYDERLMENIYEEILEESPEVVEVGSDGDLPVLMSVDMMDCGDSIAIIETNGFASRGLSTGDIEMVAISLEKVFEKGERCLP